MTRLAPGLLFVLAGCAGGSIDAPAPTPTGETNARTGLLRDFFADGKFDEAGRPLSAHITAPTEVCTGAAIEDGAVQLGPAGCEGPLAGSTQRGDIVLDVAIRATESIAQLESEEALATIKVLAPNGAPLASTTLTAGGVRKGEAWMHLSLRWFGGSAAHIAIEPSGSVSLAVGSLEIFPARFKLAVGPGSRLLTAETDSVAIEWPLEAPLPRVELAGVDLSDAIAGLVDAGEATQTQTTYRQLLEIPLHALLASLAAEVDLPQPEKPLPLVVRAERSTARMQIRRAADPCIYEGDPDAPVKVLVTGFEPFPADAWHDNVSRVGVAAMDPNLLEGAQLMRLILPVEYDNAPVRVVDAITRCGPDVVINFGQGGGMVAIEETAYNLKDTGEVPGGAPDNRGVIAAATPIEPSGPTQRTTGLPVDALTAAVEASGRNVRRSDDPGRYICNNVFYGVMGAVEGTDVRAGFVHLPYVSRFDDDDAAAWGRTLEAVVQAVVDAGAPSQ